jgi:hypothetical protein
MEHPAFAKQSSLVDETGIEPATSSLRKQKVNLDGAKPDEKGEERKKVQQTQGFVKDQTTLDGFAQRSSELDR